MAALVASSIWEFLTKGDQNCEVRENSLPASRKADDEEARRGVAERRYRPAPVAGMGGSHLVEERGEARAAPARGVVARVARRFWQNAGGQVRHRTGGKS